MSSLNFRLSVCFLAFSFVNEVHAQDVSSVSTTTGLKATTFASDPMVASPVALSVAPDGRVFVTRSRRRKSSNLDIRRNSDWVDVELSLQTVQQRYDFYRRTLTATASEKNKKRVGDYNKDGVHDYRDLGVLSEQIDVIIDTNNDGVADRGVPFATGFNKMGSGVAGGVLFHRGNVFATICPDVWRLEGSNQNGQAIKRQSIAQGFGVHVAYGGHNMHGLVAGPDGKIYWSIGDIGSDYAPHEGAVFRCLPDGSDFEVFARGLRNPQELAFDNYGNLFTGDNDSDYGDRERWVHVVEGADYGWRHHYQFQTTGWKSPTGSYNNWLDEKQWTPWFPQQAAFILPGLANISDGPCGLSYYPGTGLDDSFNNTFFLAHFKGGAAQSGVNAIRTEPKGATFKVVRDNRVISGVAATGVDFGPDSALYLAEWVSGWDVSERGRIHRVISPNASQKPIVAETKQLLSDGFDKRSIAQLSQLLAHPNQHVRRESQFELAARAKIKDVQEIANRTGVGELHRLSRIHAIWALGQMGRLDEVALKSVVPLLSDADHEIQAQAARVLGDARYRPAQSALEKCFNASSPRAKFYAGIALARMKANVIGDAFKLIEEVKTDDLYLRHACLQILKNANSELLTKTATGTSSHKRIAAVVALRNQRSPKVAAFLDDTDPLVVTEAARAINDLPLETARPALAQLINGALANDWLTRRVLNANYRLGQAESLAAFAIRSDVSEPMRIEALNMLSSWDKLNPRDRVTGAWIPFQQSDHKLSDARKAVESHFSALLSAPADVQTAAIELAVKLNIESNVDDFVTRLRDSKQPSLARVAAFRFLALRKEPRLDAQLITDCLASDDARLFAVTVRHLAKQGREHALPALREAINERSVAHQQQAYAVLAELQHKDADAQLGKSMRSLIAGMLPRAVQLDLLEAVQSRLKRSGYLRDHMKRYEDSIAAANSPLAVHTPALEGGDANAGRQVFFEHAQAQCIRCHKVAGLGGRKGGDVGPDLAQSLKKQTRKHILESIVFPNQVITKGFEQSTLLLDDGKVVTGRIIEKSETELKLQIVTLATTSTEADEGSVAKTRVIPLASIEFQRTGLSPMPKDIVKQLSARQLRDLVEFLTLQNGGSAKSKKGATK